MHALADFLRHLRSRIGTADFGDGTIDCSCGWVVRGGSCLIGSRAWDCKIKCAKTKTCTCASASQQHSLPTKTYKSFESICLQLKHRSPYF